MTQEEIKTLLKRQRKSCAESFWQQATEDARDASAIYKKILNAPEPPLPAEAETEGLSTIDQCEKTILTVMNDRKASDETFMLQPYHGGWLIHIYNAATNLHRKTVGSHDLKSAIEKLDYLPNIYQKPEECDATGDAKRTESQEPKH
jgi:hypothetical protein